MSDPRLCSIHLEALPRRDDYRRARQQLIDACGSQTLAGGRELLAAALESPKTIAPEEPKGPIVPSHFVLMDKEFVYPLKIGLNTVGRLPDNDVVIEDPSISRRHCAVVVHASNGCEVHDTASKNGTYLNGRRLAAPTRINSGDEIRMSNRQLVFLTRDDVPPIPAAQDPGVTQID